MKFLCTKCDRPMTLKDAVGPDRGSVALIYQCDTCEGGFAMLTNPHETQAVTSLGVSIGPDSARESATGNAGSGEPGFAEAAARCPFNGMLQEMGVDMSGAPANAQPAEPRGDRGDGSGKGSDSLSWSEAARKRLDSIPSFVRPMAVDGIESYARDKGYPEIDERVLDEVREHFVI